VPSASVIYEPTPANSGDPSMVLTATSVSAWAGSRESQRRARRSADGWRLEETLAELPAKAAQKSASDRSCLAWANGRD
jgi:hypothetical protein